MSIFPRLNQRTKIILPIKSNLTEKNNFIPEHTTISLNEFIPSIEDGPTVVQRYNNLTINNGATLTTTNRCCGLVLVVYGDLIVNGIISMTARGAFFQPPHNHLIKNELILANDIVYEIDIPATADEIAAFLVKDKKRYLSLNELPAIYRPKLICSSLNNKNIVKDETLAFINMFGANGGAGRTTDGAGNNGANGTNRCCGGGGGGARKKYSDTPVSGAGGTGTCYSGGSGASGAATGTTNSLLNGQPFGGKGGNGNSINGGGAGNPGGTPATTADSGGTSYPLANGTGGLLIILCTGKITIGSTGKIESLGTRGGSARTTHNYSLSGAGSGGGSINIFYGSLENNGSILATGGLAGPGYSTTQLGGKGGDGCVTLDQYNF